MALKSQEGETKTSGEEKSETDLCGSYFLKITDQDFYLIPENVHEIGARVWI